MATRTQIIKCIVVLLIQCPDISINKLFPPVRLFPVKMYPPSQQIAGVGFHSVLHCVLASSLFCVFSFHCISILHLLSSYVYYIWPRKHKNVLCCLLGCFFCFYFRFFLLWSFTLLASEYFTGMWMKLLVVSLFILFISHFFRILCRSLHFNQFKVYDGIFLSMKLRDNRLVLFIRPNWCMFSLFTFGRWQNTTAKWQNSICLPFVWRICFSNVRYLYSKLQ